MYNEGKQSFTSSVFLNGAGSAQRSVWWVNYYAYLLWQIIGIGDEPEGKRVNPNNN